MLIDLFVPLLRLNLLLRFQAILPQGIVCVNLTTVVTVCFGSSWNRNGQCNFLRTGIGRDIGHLLQVGAKGRFCRMKIEASGNEVLPFSVNPGKGHHIGEDTPVQVFRHGFAVKCPVVPMIVQLDAQEFIYGKPFCCSLHNTNEADADLFQLLGSLHRSKV